MSAAPSMPKVAAIILAAGRSSRFGRNKLLEPIDGVPMVSRVAALALASNASPVIAVVGFEAQRVAELLRPLGVTVVHNPDFSQGLSASLREGLATLPPDIDGALILLGDMPRIEPSVVDAVLAAFAEQEAQAICVAAHDGRQGNPVLWPRAYFAEIMSLSGDYGAKPLLQRHADHVVEVEVESDSIFTDFDVPASLKPVSRQA